MRIAHRRLLTWGVIPATLAIPLALFMCFAALSHNPQEEFCAYLSSGGTGNYTSQGSPCNVKWGEISFVFGGWFLVQLVLFTIVHSLWIQRSGKRAL